MTLPNYLSYNHLGSLKAVTDKNAQTIKSITYSAYGEILTDTNPNLDLKLGFAGGLYDKDTKLIRFGYRDYDPYTGRWTAKDPIDFSGGDSNLYGYVVGDPINLVDPTGEAPWFAIPIGLGLLYEWGNTPDIGEEPKSGMTPGHELALCLVGGSGVSAVRHAKEINRFGMRIAPFGNAGSKHWQGHMPHYHKRKIDPNTGKTLEGQGIGRHRPWDKKEPDNNFWDRF